jgi:hypothetical protein
MPTIKMDDTQLTTLKKTMNEIRPIHDKLMAGDTSLTQSELTTYGQAYNQWRSVISNV